MCQHVYHPYSYHLYLFYVIFVGVIIYCWWRWYPSGNPVFIYRCNFYEFVRCVRDNTMAEDDDFKPRNYQVELMKIAVANNTIIYLPTGAGKTYIAILVLKHLSTPITMYDCAITLLDVVILF